MIQVFANRKLSKKTVDIGNMQENKVTKLKFELDQDITAMGGNVYLFVTYDGSSHPYPLKDNSFKIGRELTQRKKSQANVVVSTSEDEENILNDVVWISDTLTLLTDKNSINIDAINETELPPSLKIVYDELLNLEKDLREKRDSDYWRGERGHQGPEGPQGKNGLDGHTPVKGVDYFTKDEIKEFANIFIATYGQTSFSDMITAWKSGKLVVLKGDVETALTVRMLIHVTLTKLFFGRVLAESNLVEEVIVTSSNEWTLIKNTYVSTTTLQDKLSSYATKEWVKTEAKNHVPKTTTKVFQTTSTGVIRCATNTTYTIYCTSDTQATIRGYGDQNTDSSGNQHEISGKYLTVYCGSQYDVFTDENENSLSNNGAALWYATAMEQGTLTPIGSMNVRRGVVKHPDGDQWAEISYPSGCSIVIVETK